MEKLAHESGSRYFRRALVALGVGAGVLTIASCGETAEILPNRPAVVIEKEYDDADTGMIGVKPPIFVTYPEEFLLTVSQCDRTGDPFADERGCLVDVVEVDEETYNAHAVGSQITFTE